TKHHLHFHLLHPSKHLKQLAPHHHQHHHQQMCLPPLQIVVGPQANCCEHGSHRETSPVLADVDDTWTGEQQS
ncbi:hypothetical protein A2U01_0076419, partial [Trifolium medium]|nr:hypothetical protein [Trifolium medium]